MSDDEDASDLGDEKLDVAIPPDPPDLEQLCRDMEPTGARLALADCPACTLDNGIGSAPKRWLAVRLGPVDEAFVVERVGLVSSGDEPLHLFHFESDGTVPPPEPTLFEADVEPSPEYAHERWFTWELDAPVVLAPGESMYVGLVLEGELGVSTCGDAPEITDGVFQSDDAAPFGWYPLTTAPPEIFAFGTPG